MPNTDHLVKISLITLGCSKNLIDAESMSSILEKEGFVLVPAIEDSDVVIINTCGFIESAKKEAIETILNVSDLKKPNGNVSYIVVTGCLSQRYPDEILADLPEVDAVLGTGHYHDIARVINSLIQSSQTPIRRCVSSPGGMQHLQSGRKISTHPYAWLKIAEGCSNTCTYCAIPMIRGPYRSRPFEEVVDEANVLSRQGYREIILAAQDTTSYGKDLYAKRRLPELLRAISDIDGIDSIRIMYSYMDGITDELINEMRTNPKVLHYLDMPVQHGDDRVLKRMARKDRVMEISNIIDRLRKEIPDIILRTTVIVGFPGESEHEFAQLMKMVEKWRFDRLGCFIYSAEEGTGAYLMKNRVPVDVAEDRYDRLMSLQREISLDANQSRIGSIVPVIIDSVSDDGIFYLGRSYGEAPEVDPVIMVLATSELLEQGKTYPVKIVDCSEYDMTGVTVDEHSE